MIVLYLIFSKFYFDKKNFYALKKIKFMIENLLSINLLNLNIVTDKKQIIYSAYAFS